MPFQQIWCNLSDFTFVGIVLSFCSLVNRLQKEISMETGEISKKIERGKQTTRHTQLIPLEQGGFILDTPGFSSIELYDLEKEDVWKFYKV